MKAQGFLVSSIIILLALTFLQLLFFDFQEKNMQLSYEYRIEREYFEALKDEMFISASLTDKNSLENFIRFLNFSKAEAVSKNYNVAIFAVHVANYDDEPDEINLTLINFLDRDALVDLKLNSTPEQSYSVFVQKDKYSSNLFSVDRQKDYNLLISYPESFNMSLDLKNLDSVFIFLDFNVSSDRIKYIDKSQKSYYFS